MKKNLTKIVKKIIKKIHDILFGINSKFSKVILLYGFDKETKIDEIKKRFKYFIKNDQIKLVLKEESRIIFPQIIFENSPIIIGDAKNKYHIWIKKIRTGVFDVDYMINPHDGWEWHHLINYLEPFSQTQLMESKDRLKKYFDKIKFEKLQKTYIFGTGPSLEKAIDYDWSDGYRIVCNTIVRDKEIWNHINPHIIVAGDAIYHFGHTDFAKKFRHDLKKRLSESSTLFVYPALFHQFIYSEFSELHDKLVPIPQGENSNINTDLINDFELPMLGNVLGLLLLPLACNLSKTIGLWGFDGRAPDDKLFWSNSSRHSYPELMPSLLEAHPGFFNYYLDKHDPNKYIKEYHGDILNSKLKILELNGYSFLMLHQTWTPILKSRIPSLIDLNKIL